MAQVYLFSAKEEGGHMKRLNEKLSALAITTEISAPCENFADTYARSIASAKVVVIFLTKKMFSSGSAKKALYQVETEASRRRKHVIFVAQWGSVTLSDMPDFSKPFLENGRQYIPEDGLHAETDYNRLALLISNMLEKHTTKELLYSKIAAFKQIGTSLGCAVSLSKLIVLLWQELELEKSPQDNMGKYVELCQNIVELRKSMLELYRNKNERWCESVRESSSKFKEAISAIQQMLDTDFPDQNQITMVSIAILCIPCFLDIYISYVRLITLDDVHFPGQEFMQKYISKHTHCCTIYPALFQQHQAEIDSVLPYAERQIILSAPAYFDLSLDNLFSGDRPEDWKLPETLSAKLPSEEEQKLWEVAECIQKSNHIFRFLGEKEEEAQFLRCLKTSYERLLKFSTISGSMHVGMECVERIEELKQKLELLDNDTFSDTTTERAIRALLGFTVSEDRQYDVFLSYKHADLDLAQNVFHHLQRNLLCPFLDTESLPEIGKSEYEAAIMHALDNSKHFIVVLSALEYLDSHWVELEMRTFRHEIVEGRKPNANFLILATDDVYDKIAATNKTCLDICYRSYEILRFSQYQDILVKYLK